MDSFQTSANIVENLHISCFWNPSYVCRDVPAYACFGPCTQVATHVCGPRAFLVILFPKIDFCAFKNDIFHFNTPQVNLIFDWALKWPSTFRVWASLGNGGLSRKGYKMRCLHLGMAMSVLHFLYLTEPCPWNVGNVCFTFLLCGIALCMMYVCIYIYIYMPACVWLIVHFVWWTLMVKRATLADHKCTWPCSVGMHSRRLL